MLAVAAGLALVRFGGSIALVYVGAFLAGAGFAAFMSATLAYCGMIAKPEVLTSSTTIIMTINQIAILLSSFLFTIAHMFFESMTETAAGFVLAIIVDVVLAIVCVVARIYPAAYDAKGQDDVAQEKAA